MKTRMYDPKIGRFLSPDSEIIGDTALAYNPYIYCANNPISRIDPNGKSWISSAWNWVKDTAVKIKDAVVAGYNKVMDVIGEVGNTVINYYSNSSNKYIKKTAQAVSNTVDWVGGDWKKAAVVGLAVGIISGAAIWGISAGISASVSCGSSTAVAKQVIDYSAKNTVTKSGVNNIISGFTKHGINRIIERGITPAVILNTIKNPNAVIAVAGNRGMELKYISEEAVIILNNSAKVITGWLR